MTAFAPVPDAPELNAHPVERFLLDAQPDAEWGVAPSLEELGRLTILRHDLTADIERLTGLVERVDGLLAAWSCARRDAG